MSECTVEVFGRKLANLPIKDANYYRSVLAYLDDCPQCVAYKESVRKMKQTEYITRNLTDEEAETFHRRLFIALTKQAYVDAVFGIIVDMGLGIFVAEPKDK